MLRAAKQALLGGDTVEELREELVKKTHEYEELKRIVSVDQCKVQETLK